MYPYITLGDGTEFTHSEMLPDGRVRVCFTRGPATATCFIPGYEWSDIQGFSDEEMVVLRMVLRSSAHLVMEYSQTGGVAGAAGISES